MGAGLPEAGNLWTPSERQSRHERLWAPERAEDRGHDTALSSTLKGSRSGQCFCCGSRIGQVLLLPMPPRHLDHEASRRATRDTTADRNKPLFTDGAAGIPRLLLDLYEDIRDQLLGGFDRLLDDSTHGSQAEEEYYLRACWHRLGWSFCRRGRRHAGWFRTSDGGQRQRFP